MSWLNVFDKTYKSLSWFHPRNFKYLKSDLECAKMRATKGWCYRDWYNLDSWFSTVLPELLEDFVKHHHASPNYDYAKTPPELIPWGQKWISPEDEKRFNKNFENYLLEIAHHLRNSNKDYLDLEEETETTDSNEAILVRYKKYNEYCQKELNTALDMLKPVFFELWD